MREEIDGVLPSGVKLQKAWRGENTLKMLRATAQKLCDDARGTPLLDLKKRPIGKLKSARVVEDEDGKGASIQAIVALDPPRKGFMPLEILRVEYVNPPEEDNAKDS